MKAKKAKFIIIYQFGKTATADEWIAAFKEWVNSHRGLNFPTLSDEDISRESIYGERG